ncbi:MAG: cation-translocating P-type ATPase [Promethearchaeota archaeon]
MSSSGESQLKQEGIHDPHSQTLEKLAQQLHADLENGLMSGEAQKRLDIFGPNQLPRIRGSFWRVYLAPILNGLILIYLVAICLMAALVLIFNTPGVEQALIWVVVIVFNAILAIVQQYRAQKKLEALQSLTADTTVVIREGLKKEINTKDVVPGDIVVLAQGDKIPADGRLLEANHLSVVEASLTGESAPVEKEASAKPLLRDIPLHERSNMVYSGTYIATGSGRCLVANIGESTEIGQISEGLETLNTGEIPLRRKVNRLAVYLGVAALFLGILGFVSYIVFPRPVDGIFLTLPELAMEAIINAMTVAPINIPLLTTIILLTGVLGMATLGVIVSDLTAVETIGRVSIICTDKTGTLTRSEMMVSLVWDGSDLFHVTGEGYSPKGAIQLVEEKKGFEKPIEVENYNTLSLLIRVGALNNDAQVVPNEESDFENQWKVIGDPTEAALIVLLRKSGIPESSLYSAYQLEQDYPFDSRLKRMTRVFRNPEGDYIAFVKGATDVLLERSTAIGDDRTSKRLAKKQIKEISDYADTYAKGGYRVLSLGIRYLDELPSGKGMTPRDQIEQQLTYLGFVCIVDPPREGIRDAVEEVANAGIRTVMITGDAAGTAETIGRQLAIVNEMDLVVEGKDAPAISDDDFKRVSVFARVNPEDKQVIVERYQKAKHAVAMTGDGVNDALALSMSDVGIAMGITGTDVAKEASDLIIADDSYNSIVEGVRQGRGLFNKIRTMILFYIAINVAESIIFFATFYLGLRFLTSWQHIFLAISSHTWPGLALTFDRNPKYVMDEPPRDTEGVITRPLGTYLIINAILIFVGAAIAYFGTLYAFLPGTIPGDPLNIMKAQIMTICVLVITESLMMISIRRINRSALQSIRDESYWFIYLMLAFVFLMVLVVMYSPLINEVLAGIGINFYFVPLTTLDWLVVIALAVPAVVGMEVIKWAARHREIHF